MRPELDPKAIVARGYDRIADAYMEKFGASTVRSSKLDELVVGMAVGATVLDLGCGAGLPVARRLTENGFVVTGVDGSEVQIKRAAANVPGGRFIHSDMMSVDFRDESFDAVCAFYSISHVPRSEHSVLFQSIARWLRPGGRFLASFGTLEGDWSKDWLGAPMYFSHHDPDETLALLAAAGFLSDNVERVEQDSEPTEFLWFTGRMPSRIKAVSNSRERLALTKRPRRTSPKGAAQRHTRRR
jgi:SAM-dependent methyltransferase